MRRVLRTCLFLVFVSPTLPALAQTTFPRGTVIAYAGKLTPQVVNQLRLQGWLVCDGRTESTERFYRLATLLGSTFAKGKTPPPGTFFLPDFTGRAPVGAFTASPTGLPQLGQEGGAARIDVSASMLPHAHQGMSTRTADAIITNISGGAGTGARRLPETAGGEHQHDVVPVIGPVKDDTKVSIPYLPPHLPVNFLIKWR